MKDVDHEGWRVDVVGDRDVEMRPHKILLIPNLSIVCRINLQGRIDPSDHRLLDHGIVNDTGTIYCEVKNHGERGIGVFLFEDT